MTGSQIGLIGAGFMGQGIALNLLRKGWPLAVLDHPGNQPLDELCGLGAKVVESVTELAHQSDVLLLCVTGSLQVESILLGTQGALTALRPNAIVIDCSTSIPAFTQTVAQAVHAAGGRFLDAPMTRTPKEAREGRLNLLVGGDADLLAQCLPLLRCFAEGITHVGPVGSGHRMKLLHNYVSLGSIALLAEAAACALDAGMQPQVFVDVLAQGGGAGVALDRITPYLLKGDPSALRFAMSNAFKDLGYYGTMAQDSQAARGIAQAVYDTYAIGVAKGGGRALVPELVALLRTGHTPP